MQENNSITKCCVMCNETKPISLFGVVQSGSYQNNICRPCMREWNKLSLEERNKVQGSTSLVKIEKVCPGCHLLLPREAYYKNKSTSDGMSARCKVCDNAGTRARRLKLTELSISNRLTVPDKKTCVTCGEEKPIACFGRSVTYADGHISTCKQCANVKWRQVADSPGTRERWLLSRIQSKCNKDGIPFDLTTEDIIIPETCPILGIPLVFGKGDKGYKSSATESSPSVDRIDPNGGYIKGNIIIISWRANRLKGNATIAELIKIADFYKQYLIMPGAGIATN